MADEIGIHIRARANLEEVDAAARKLENFGGASTRVSSQVRQLVESLKESAGTDVNNLVREIDKLQKKIQTPGLSAKERKQAKGEIDDIKAKIKELKQLQKVKADDYGSMEQNARMYLDQLKNKRALTNAEKEHIKEVEKGLAYLEKYNKAKLELGGAHLDKIQQDLKQQDEEAKRAGLGGAGQYVSRFGRKAVGLVIGGTIVGVAVQAMKKWAEVDTAIVKTSASLDDMGKSGVEALMEIGKEFGYTKAQSLAFVESLTAISGKMNEVEARGFGTFLDWGRAMGVGGVGLQMRELQRWGGEGVKPGDETGKDKYFLTQFTAMARMMNMREGRMTEFIETAVNMTKVMERTFIKIEDKDILRNILIPGMVFGGADRGRGARGQSYMQRLNEGLTGTGDLMNLMMYRTIGVPKSFEQMWGYRKAREQGVFGTVGGKPLLMGLMENYQSMFGGKYRAMAMMKASMPNMSAVEIEQTYKMFEGLKAGTWNLETGEISAKRRKELEAKGLKYGKFVNEQGETKSGFVGLGAKDWETLLKIPEFIETWAGKDKVSAGEKWKVQIESMQYSIGGIFGQTTISLLTGLAKGVDVIATKFGKDYGYESQARLIDEAYGQYQKPLRDELKGINERIKEIDKITEAAKDKEKGDPDYRSELTLNALIQEREKLKEKQKSSVFQWVGNLGTTTKPEGEIFDLDLSEWKKQSLELSKKGFVGSRLKNRIEVQKAKEKVIGEFWRKHTDLSTEEKIRQIKLAEEYIAKEIEKQNKIKLQEYYYGQIGSKQLELQKVNANIQYQEDKGLGYSKLDVKRSILQADINKLQKVNEIRASKLVIENPVDMGNRGATITNHYHIIVEGGGELFNLPINKETGLPDFFPIGPKDNE